MSAPAAEARPRRWAVDAAAIVALVVVPLVPAAIESGSALALARLPAESLIALLVLAILPWLIVRIVVAAVFGLFVVVAIVVAGIDRGYQAALGIRFVPIDWPQLGDAYGVLAATIGSPAAFAVVAGIVLVAVATGTLLAWAALRIAALLRRSRRGRTAIVAVSAVWIVAALVAQPTRATAPVAAAASIDAVGSAVSRAADTLRAQAAFARGIADDPYADEPVNELLAALRGKDVVVVFVESYGRIALEGAGISDGVTAVLDEGEAALATHGYAAQSAWLTSPTYGGLSWLAHATLHTGLWVDRQALYSEVIRSDRLTLSAAFRQAGWRTVGVVPSNTEDWPFGASFYGYEKVWDATNVGYRGPAFGYARIPDQYTLRHFADNELGPGHAPVMAEIDLASSHGPWTPLPRLVPWAQIGDGSIYHSHLADAEQDGRAGASAGSARDDYGRSIEYSLGALLSFLQSVDDADLVVIALGDHQPAAVVSGADAGRDVPISVIAKDPAVFDAIAGWRWESGLRPGDAAPVWRMDAFRDRFFEAFRSAG